MVLSVCLQRSETHLERRGCGLAEIVKDTLLQKDTLLHSLHTPFQDREGILPRLLREILEARVMVKKLMKYAKKDNNTR